MKNLSILIVAIFLFSCKQESKRNMKLSGPVFGTSYSVMYNAKTDYLKQFDSLFYVVNRSMSTYQANSYISRINNNESKEVDAHFEAVFQASKRLHDQTNGVFDPTIGTIVNALGFGPEQKIERLDSLKVDSLMQFVGIYKVYNEGQLVFKKYPETFIDFNAIAKGYAVDVIADFLDGKDIDNYLVEIGGEIRSKGVNIEKNAAWTVGIDKPNFDGTQSVLKAITLEDNAMATSGTYRKFKVDENGNRYAHIIDAKTGYPSKSSLLSVSVIAPDCMTADGFATAFQAMGLEKVKSFLEYRPELKVFLVYENDNKELETLALNGFPSN